MLNLKAEVESSASQCSFKRLVPGGFNLGLIGSTCTALPGDQPLGPRATQHSTRAPTGNRNSCEGGSPRSKATAL